VIIIEIKSYTSWLIVFSSIIGAFILLVFQLGVPIKLDQLIILLTFVLGATGLLIFFLLYKNKPKELDIFQAGERVRELWQKHFDEVLHWKTTPEKVSTKTYEDNNTTYFGYLFDSDSYTNIVVIWNTLKNVVADWDTDPSPERLKHPFLGFSPVEGRYRKEMPKDLEARIPLVPRFREEESESFGDELRKEE